MSGLLSSWFNSLFLVFFLFRCFACLLVTAAVWKREQTGCTARGKRHKMMKRFSVINAAVGVSSPMDVRQNMKIWNYAWKCSNLASLHDCHISDDPFFGAEFMNLTYLSGICYRLTSPWCCEMFVNFCTVSKSSLKKRSSSPIRASQDRSNIDRVCVLHLIVMLQDCVLLYQHASKQILITWLMCRPVKCICCIRISYFGRNLRSDTTLCLYSGACGIVCKDR